MRLFSSMVWKRAKLTAVALSIQIVLTVLMILNVDYGADASVNHNLVPNLDRPANPIDSHIAMFQDINVMIFVGFGFLMTFLKHYGYGAVGLTLVCTAYAVQTSLLIRGAFGRVDYITIDINSLLSGLFSSATVLISFGALIGKISPMQLLVMTVIEVVVSVSNEHIGTEIFKAADVGGSIFLHTFGAYFGLAVSYVIYDKQASNLHEETSKESDTFSMIGTLFLWIYWPSFNGIAAEGEARHRAVVNTYMALMGSCVSAFILSSLCDENGKLSMVHIQNATLAGGVAMGATADMMIAPANALLVGLTAGTISLLGYRFLQPYLLRFYLHDTCGVHNLHGMPGVLAGILSVLVARLATYETYSTTLYERFPGRVPRNGTDVFSDTMSLGFDVKPGFAYDAKQQAIAQLLALGITLLIAIVSGLTTGFILLFPFFEPPETRLWFDDSAYWNLPSCPVDIKTEIRTAPMTPQEVYEKSLHRMLKGRKTARKWPS